jgi:ribosome-associated protein
MLHITPTLSIDETCMSEEFVRADGPGGQNVNKVATAVQLRMDVTRAALPDAVRARLQQLAGKRLTAEGVLIIEARRFRTQERNRQDALDRLVALLRQAAELPKPRVSTRIPHSVQQQRLATKKQRGRLKQQRGFKLRSEDE